MAADKGKPRDYNLTGHDDRRVCRCTYHRWLRGEFDVEVSPDPPGYWEQWEDPYEAFGVFGSDGAGCRVA
jgi:hypothetical protein